MRIDFVTDKGVDSLPPIDSVEVHVASSSRRKPSAVVAEGDGAMQRDVQRYLAVAVPNARTLKDIGGDGNPTTVRANCYPAGALDRPESTWRSLAFGVGEFDDLLTRFGQCQHGAV